MSGLFYNILYSLWYIYDELNADLFRKYNPGYFYYDFFFKVCVSLSIIIEC
jgi:hypothetical protein